MTEVLGREFSNMLNPCFGAVLLHAFLEGFNAQQQLPASLFHLFLPVPIVTVDELADTFVRTNKSSGMRKAVEKLDEGMLLSLQVRVIEFRQISFDSIRMAIGSRLILLDAESAAVHRPTSRLPEQVVPISAKTAVDASKKLGFWCSQMNLQEVSTVLRINY